MAPPSLGEAGARRLRLGELEAVLVPLVPALERLHEAQREQRRLVVAGDLTAIVTVNATIEAASARIASLEQRRLAIQADLEAELGVQGLRAVIEAAAIDPRDRTRLGHLFEEVSRLVGELREQGRRNAELLDAAIGLAHRTRLAIERLRGVEPAYDPMKARREQMAQRARANLAALRATPGAAEPAPPAEPSVSAPSPAAPPVSGSRPAASPARPARPGSRAPGEAPARPAPRTEAP